MPGTDTDALSATLAFLRPSPCRWPSNVTGLALGQRCLCPPSELSSSKEAIRALVERRQQHLTPTPRLSAGPAGPAEQENRASDAQDDTSKVNETS